MKSLKQGFIEKGAIVIYKAPNKEIEVDVRLEKDTVWLNLNQISELFDTDKSGISRHIKNIYEIHELERSATVAKIATVQIEGTREITRNIDYYNLDMVLSVGYRINSARATQFRIWATKVLKDYLVKGYAINEKRLLETQNKFKELQTTIAFMQEKAGRKVLSGQEGEILNLLSSYAKTLTLLEEYDNGKITETKGRISEYTLTYDNCMEIVRKLKKELIIKNETGELFGIERSKSFEGIINNLYQTYNGNDLYPNIEDKAASLLYLVIKDHPFSDGNKRTASFLFIYFLDKTCILYRNNGEKKINDNALTALALLIAESNPTEKDLMLKLIKNLLGD